MTTLKSTRTRGVAERLLTIRHALLPLGLNTPPPTADCMLVECAKVLGQTYLTFAWCDHCKDNGHHLAPTCSLLGGN